MIWEAFQALQVLKVTWEHSNVAYKYKIEVSTDNVTWTVAVNKTTNTTVGQIMSDPFTASARYVRITITSVPTGIWTSFYEFKVWGSVAATNLLLNPGFETAIATNWTGSSSTITAGTVLYSGTKGCSVTARTDTWGGPAQNILTAVAANGAGTYYIEFWVKMASGTATVFGTFKYSYNNTTYYVSVNGSVGTAWTKISGNVAISYTGTLQSCDFYIETGTGTTDFYVDDCVLNFTGLKSASVATDVATVNIPKVSVYPNPASNNLSIELSALMGNEKAQIYNTVGKIVKEFKISSLRQQVNIEDLPSGIYIVCLKQSRNLSAKFIKQ